MDQDLGRVLESFGGEERIFYESLAADERPGEEQFVLHRRRESAGDGLVLILSGTL